MVETPILPYIKDMRIKIVSDFACPWCMIGWARLQRALAQRPGLSVEVRWMPFQLNPAMPAEGMDRRTYILRKFGDMERGRGVYDAAMRVSRAEGLGLNLDRIQRMPSTLLAHALMRRVSRGRGARMLAESLFRAFLAEGEDIGRPSVLVPLALAAGATLPAGVRANADVTTLEMALEADIAAVVATDGQLRGLGIQAIPCYIFAETFVLSGAQEPRAFLPILDVLAAEAQSLRDQGEAGQASAAAE